MTRLLFLIAITASLTITVMPTTVQASNSVGKIYNPYVQQLEQEIEYELIVQTDKRDEFDNQSVHKFAYGQSLSDRWFIEVGVVGENTNNQELEISAYEIEFKYQISEQGQFNNDWGVLFEIEREKTQDVWEFGTTLIALHEWKKWIGTANISLIYETGSAIDDEVETELATQLRYRSNPLFEPGIEFFKSESTSAIGPSASGKLRLGGGKKLFWSTAALFSVDGSKPDNVFRFNLEFEF